MRKVKKSRVASSVAVGALASAFMGLSAESIGVPVAVAVAVGLIASAPLLFILIMGEDLDDVQTPEFRRRHVERSVDQLFVATSHRLALTVEAAGREGGRCLRGSREGAGIVVNCVPRNDIDATWATSVSVETHHPRLAEIDLRSRWKAPTIVDGGAVTAPVMGLVETGSAELDKLIEVRGRSSTALALLAAPVRSALTSLAHRGVVVLSQGHLTYEINDRPTTAEELQDLVDSTISAAKTVDQVVVDDVPVAVAEAACHDPEAGVRAQALRTLVAELSGHPATEPALQRALSDESAAVRVVAASALGEAGLSVLREIAANERSEEDAAARAINVLGRRLPTEDLISTLDSALRAGRVTVSEAAVTSLGRPGDVPACARLAKVLQGGDGRLAVAAATALARSALPEAERPLIAALGSTWVGVRHAAACALGDVGGPEALVALHALLGREQDPTDVETKRAAQRAIARIRQRVADLGPGHVSLALPQGGDLAVSDAPGQGRVSLSEDR